MKSQVRILLEFSGKSMVCITMNGRQWTDSYLGTYEECEKLLRVFVEIGFKDVTDYRELDIKRQRFFERLQKQKLREGRE